ncbi:MAG: divergent PAP2 family protein [Candidatus Margulisiibacteriota bacterium]
MKELIAGLLSNFTFITVFISGFLSQSIKVFLYRFEEKKWNLWHFFEAGGMPSSHSATVTALTLGVALQLGWHTALFTACLVFGYIVIYDAMGVRRATGKQAEILNKMVDDVYLDREVKVEKLKEIFGHDLHEVIAGVGLAILVTLITYYVYFIR